MLLLQTFTALATGKKKNGGSSPANNQKDVSSKGGRRISWENPLSSTTARAGDAGGILDGDGGARSGTNQVELEERCASAPEVQMQMLVKVGKLVRAAARRGGHNKAQRE